MAVYAIGFDPGGKDRGRGKFGWAVLEASAGPSVLATGRSIHAKAAWSAVLGVVDRESIVSVGIDGPLGYDFDADRQVDRQIRKHLSGPSPSTQNSLRGACLVQSFLVANLVAGENLGIRISESYPRAVRTFGGSLRLPETSLGCGQYDAPCLSGSCDECDAVASGLSGWAMYQASFGQPPAGWVNWHLDAMGQALFAPDIEVVVHEYWMPRAA